MKNYLLFIFVLFIVNAYSQKLPSEKSPVKPEVLTSKNSNPKPPTIKKSESIETTVITIDVSSPTFKSVSIDGNVMDNKLVVSNKNPLAVRLVNSNPIRYKYVLRYDKINLFGTGGFSIQSPNVEDARKESKNYSAYDDSLPFEEIEDKLSTLESGLELYVQSLKNAEYLDKVDFNKRILEFYQDYNLIQDSVEFWKMTFEGNIDDTIDVTDDLIKNNDYEKKLKSVKTDLDKLNTINSSSYLLPLDIYGDNIDYVNIVLEIYDGEKTTPTVYEYKVWLRGGLKIDVSGGAFLTSLFDKEYVTTDAEVVEGSDENVGKKTIRENDLGKYDFGFGAMVNISFRGASWVRPTLNFGTLLTTNQKFQIMSGFGLILGKNERFIISGGITMGRVSILDKSFKADDSIAYDLGTTGDVPTNEKFDFGHFIGISYNFSKPKTKNE